MYSQVADKYSGVALFLLVVVFLFTYMVLTFYNPKFVRRTVNGHKTCENDVAVTMLWALGITLLVLVILALIAWAAGSSCQL